MGIEISDGNFVRGLVAWFQMQPVYNAPDSVQRLMNIADRLDSVCPAAEIDAKNAALPSQDETIATLTRERDEARENGKATLGLLEYAENSIARLERKWLFQMGRADTAEARLSRAMEAMTPSAGTKATYIGEFYMGVTLRAGGEEEYRRVQIPWTTIKEIMAAIRTRAAGKQEGGE